MKFVGFKEIAIKSIVVDAVDIRKRQDRQHVKELADDAEQNGGEYMHPPVIQAESSKLIAGRDRIAGALVKKRKKIWVHVAECTDDEAKALELAENLYRRPMEATERAKAIAALVKLREQQITAEDDAKREAGETVSERPQDSPIARARREVAKTAAISTATVRSHEAHVAQRGEPVELPQAQTSQGREITAYELPKDFKNFGIAVSPEATMEIAMAVDWLADAEGKARQVLRAMSDAERYRHYAVSPAHIQRIRECAAALGHAIREAMPAGLCWYCKARPDLMENCAGCGGVGVVGRHAGDHVPEELKRTDIALVMVNGEVATYGDAPVAKPKKNGKSKGIKVDVVDEAGVAHELTLEKDGLPGGDEEIPF